MCILQTSYSDTGFYDKDISLLSQLLATDIKWTSLILKAIGYMCDGQHRTLQHCLREQPDNFKVDYFIIKKWFFLLYH